MALILRSSQAGNRFSDWCSAEILDRTCESSALVSEVRRWGEFNSKMRRAFSRIRQTKVP